MSLRPLLPTLVSVAVHGGAIGVALLASAVVLDRPAELHSVQFSDFAGSVDSTPSLATEPRLEEPVTIEAEPVPTPADPTPVEPPPLVEERVAEAKAEPVDELPPEEGARARPVLPGVRSDAPTRRTRPAATASASPVSLTVANAGPSRPASMASVRGAAGVSSASRAHPTNRSPVYPPIALKNGWEGTSWLLVEVLEDGRVGRVTLEESSGHSVLDDASVETVRDWTYEPALRGGAPAREWVRLPFRWRVRSI